MKTLSNIATIAGLAAAASLQAYAIEGIRDEAAPPDIVLPKTNINQGSAYLGVVTNTLPEALSAHLGIQRGVIVTGVMPDGPAADAGLKTNDIITRIGDQEVNKPTDLTRIIYSKQPGDTIQMDALQKGQMQSLNITLSERSKHPSIMRSPRPRILLPGVPDPIEERLRNMIEGKVLELDIPNPQPRQQPFDPQIENMMRDMNRRMQQHLFEFHHSQEDLPPGNATEFQHNSTIKVLDDEGSIEITSTNDIRTLTARDTNNAIVWSGPWGSEKDKQAAPEDIRKRVEQLKIEDSLNGTGFNLHLKRGL